MAAILSVVATPVMAATAPVAPASINPARVLSAVTGEWNNDGVMDRAVLIDDADNTAADLVVYFGGEDQGFKLAGFAHDIAFAGAMFGNTPSLKTSKDGALQVYSENYAVGRDHWDRTLTLAWRNGQFVVAGLTLHASDTLDPKAGGTCDINFLSGKGLAGKKAITVPAGGVALRDWSDDKVPAACQF